MFALLASTRFIHTVPSVLIYLAILVNFSTGADALETHAPTPEYLDTVPETFEPSYLLVALLPFFCVVLAGFMSTILTIWTRTIRPFLDSLLMQLVNIDTDDSVNVCCFSMRQKSQSHAFSRFSKMVSSFHMGGKIASYHVDNESADAIKRLSMACNCAYDYDMATMAASLFRTLNQQLTKLARQRLPMKLFGKTQSFSGKRMLKGKNVS